VGEGPSLTCDRTGGRETDSVQDRDSQEGCKDDRSQESCTNANERNKTDWMESLFSATPHQSNRRGEVVEVTHP